MHILIGILTALGTIALVVWRVYVAVQRARAVKDAVGRAGDYLKRKRSEGKADARPGSVPEDPREAAAAMMVALAQSDGALTAVEEAVIRERMRQHFEADEATLDDLFGRGRWLAREVGDLHSFLGRMTPPVIKVCTEQEQRDLLGMLADVAGADGPPATIEREAVGHVARRLGLRPPPLTG